ncbi:RCC1 domain-containing protein [Corallococcus terminator]
MRVAVMSMVVALMGCQVEGLDEDVANLQEGTATEAVLERHPRDLPVDSGYVDARGIEHHLSANASTRRTVRAHVDYPGCEFDYADASNLSYRGYTVTGSNGVRNVRVSWWHAVPADIALLPGSSNSYARTRLTQAPGCGTNSAYTTAPVSVTFLNSYTDTWTGLVVNRYEVSHTFQVSDVDFGQYSGFSSTFRLMTDCGGLGAVFPQTQSDVFSPQDLLAAGDETSLSVRTDASIWGAGFSGYGSLGDDYPQDHTAQNPLKVSVLSCMKAVSTSYLSVMGLRSDGTVWGWGNNFFGQLGIGTISSAHYTPTQVQNLTNVRVVSAGPFHSLALRGDGTVWAWGNGYYGKLATGTEDSTSVPVLATTLTGLISVSAGGSHSMALRSDGTVWTWGGNGAGQLGDGTTTQRNLPVQTTGLSGVISISAGDGHSLALKSDGTLWAWGHNTNGQLGDGTTIHRNTAAMIPGLVNVVAMSAGTRHSLALKADGTVWAWGFNDKGQLGDGTVMTRLSPVQVSGFERGVAVKAGFDHSLAMRADGVVWTWGANVAGQAGNGTEGNHHLTPILSSLR